MYVQKSKDELHLKMLRKIENRIFPTMIDAFKNMADGNTAIVTTSFDDLGLNLSSTVLMIF